MPNQPKTKGRTFRIPDLLYDEAKAKATERGETVTDVILESLGRYVNPTPRQSLTAKLNAAVILYDRQPIADLLGVTLYQLDKYRRYIPEDDEPQVNAMLTDLTSRRPATVV